MAVIDTAAEHSQSQTLSALDLTSAAENISRLFTRAFTLFAKCDSLYNSSKQMSDSDITTLG